MHDALKRRCLYYWIDYPDFQKEMQIISSRLPDAPRRLAEQVTGFVQELRETELYKIPGISETLDWTSALMALNQRELEPEVIDDTLGMMLKYQDSSRCAANRCGPCWNGPATAAPVAADAGVKWDCEVGSRRND